jgi:hypothetical protein
MDILSLFIDPADAILKAKKTKSMGTSVFLLLLVSLLMAISSGITIALATNHSISYGSYDSSYGYYPSSYHASGPDMSSIVIGAFVAFMSVFLGGMFIGYLISVAMRTLGGTGGFFEGLTTVSYASFVPLISLVASSLLSVVGAFSRDAAAIGIVMLLTAVVLLWGMVLGFATLYRALKELFSTDMVTALAGAGVLILATIVLFYQIVMMVFMRSMMML